MSIVDFQMLDAALVLRQMKSAGRRLNLVILDACRNNPFGGRGLRARGALAQMQAPEGTQSLTPRSPAPWSRTARTAAVLTPKSTCRDDAHASLHFSDVQ